MSIDDIDRKSTKEFIDNFGELCDLYAMDKFLILDPDKLRAARGDRTLEEIASASKYAFKPQQLSAYERGLYRPRLEKIPILLEALGVQFTEISKPVDGLAA